MVNVQEGLHENLKLITSFAPTLKNLFTEDVAISISDRETIIMDLKSKELNVRNMLGIQLPDDAPMSRVMRMNKLFSTILPKEALGVPLSLVVAPIHDNNGKVIGSISISKSLNNQANLMHVAETFAASSQEIGAATEELSTSAQNLTNNMNEVATAQQHLTEQVNNSAKILDMINSVAKNTRILGFNAGIEAARSGDHGRGFSVVAKEITKLADQSAHSVNEIRKLLDLMKHGVDDVAKTVEDTLSISAVQASAIAEISENIQHLTEVAVEIEDLSKKI